MTITIDTSRCIGCGMCAYTAPAVFRIVGKYSTVLEPPATPSTITSRELT